VLFRSVAVVAALIAQVAEPRVAVVALVALIVADVIVVTLFGRYLLHRLILRPMGALTAAAREIADGDLARRAPSAETLEFNDLADQFNQMTERLLDAQSQLVRAEKLAGIGRLAAGVAHEVGNPLASVSNYVEVLRKRGVDKDVVAALGREVERIDSIVRGLLAYARPQEEQSEFIDAAAVLKSAVELLTQQGVLRNMKVQLENHDGVPPVRARFHDLEQVAVNLLLNAADAAPGGSLLAGVQPWIFTPGGEVTQRRSDPASAVHTNRTVSRRPLRPDMPAGTRGALLYVADSGPGVPAAERDLIFDPFYTTKAPGAGTGLGLAIVQRTVHELGGIVWVDDAREGGAAFNVFLPEARAS